MTTETTLKAVERLYKALQDDKNETAQLYAKQTGRAAASPDEYRRGYLAELPGAILGVLLADLKNDIRKETAKKSGNASRLKAATDILKAGAAGGARPVLGYAWTDADGMQCICDGFRAARLAQPLPLPEKPEALNAPDIKRYIPQKRIDALTLPGSAELNAYIKIQKASGNKQPSFDFGDGLPVVNYRSPR